MSAALYEGVGARLCKSVLTNVVLRSESRAACAQSFTLWQKATIEIMRHDHSTVLLLVRTATYI